MSECDNELVTHAIQAEVTLEFGNDGNGRPVVYLIDTGFTLTESFIEDFMQHLDAVDYEVLTTDEPDESITVAYYFEEVDSDE